MIPYNTVKPNVPLRKQKNRKRQKFFFTVWFPACTLVKALSISSYISSHHLTIILHEKEKFRLYLPRSLLSTRLMHGLICNVCYYITSIYCTTKSVHRTFSVSRVLLGREPYGLILVRNHTFSGLPYGRLIGHSYFLKEIAVVRRVLVKI